MREEEGSPIRHNYEVTTIQYDRDGSKKKERIERYQDRPKEFKDVNNSMKMLETIKRDS